jgi:tetratricopeptide (TPR) repeat protein
MTFRRWIASLSLAAIGATACGGKTVPPARTASEHALPPANPIAAAKLAQAAALYKGPATTVRTLELLREAAKLDENLWEARLNIGIVLAESSDLVGAEAALVEGSHIAPDEEDLAAALANVRRRRGDSKVAADGLTKFIATHATSDATRSLAVMVLRESGQVDEAIKQARLLLTRNPGNSAALAELALCHLAHDELEIAELLVKQAIEFNPKSAAAQRTLGLIELHRGEDARAFAAFQLAAMADPKDSSARINMGGVLLRAGAYVKAEEQFRAVLAITSEDSNAKLGLAAARRAQGTTKDSGPWLEARQLLESILSREPHNISALYNLATLLGEQLKKPREASAVLDRFLNDAPEAHTARREAERLVRMYAEVRTPPATTPTGAKTPTSVGTKVGNP